MTSPIERVVQTVEKGHETLREDGYTLIELVVVIALISIVFSVAMPRFRDNVLVDQRKKTARWLITQAHHLKQQSAREKKTYILHVDVDAGKLWVSTPDMEDAALEKAEKEAFLLKGDVSVVDVEYPVRGKVSTGRADIYFYAKGYSDKALIHMQQGTDRQFSFLFEPFLPYVEYVEDYAEFDD
ncbi:MAG: type II secretion system GspH family protein [Deltaproteobacteria bacterium]|nr:type II secretion system GspH family protein [Deltaproteobacteria bacterium]